jgi:hypothetical protein
MKTSGRLMDEAKRNTMKKLLLLLPVLVAGVVLAQTTYVNSARSFKGPQAWKDKDSGITFYVESDGRHVAAISGEGKVLWNRDPFVEGKLEAYRVQKPQIVFIGKPNESMAKRHPGKFVAINFNSSQAGIMDFEKGDFTFLGQD